MLEVAGLRVRYGVIEALHGVDLVVRRGEIVTVIGANGAGKTTLLKAISGLVPAAGGSIRHHGEQGTAELGRLRPHEIVARGVGHAPEGRRIFQNLTVRENLGLGAYLRRDRAAIESELAEILTLFPRLQERFAQNAGTLSGGEQQMLAMARALMSRPSLLLLDEPSLGLAPKLVRAIFGVIRTIRSRGTTLLLVEQNARLALEAADRAYVLETGSVALSGTASELASDPRVQRVYLGGDA
ncbi:MAG: ABC transporter ATP-binding protein [Deltaproteobacteria bacterium]|nr:ABC transporter ATP-binding protein [Deltaproteobacteria bacterium]